MKGLKFLFALVAVSGVAGMGMASITDVEILPETPTTFDAITIVTEGLSGSGGVEIAKTDFTMDGTNLELDIFLNVGPLTVMTPWVHSEDIGPLPLGTYDLTVKANYAPHGTSVYTTSSFEVVPEPTSILLFGSVFIVLKSNSLRKKGF